MFNNDNFETNGEKKFYESIKNEIDVIFDVGCRDGNFFDFKGIVHYFDPIEENIKKLSMIKNENNTSYFNSFGLGNENGKKYFYPKFGSFVDRIESTKEKYDTKVLLEIKKSKDYVIKQNVSKIDFLKIDTEGYEFEVILGFEDYITNIKIIQFEYGGTFIDSKIKLINVVNYLQKYGFYDFSYLTDTGKHSISDFTDHYQYCNIVCKNKNYY